jgi:DNA polymerase I-like protein with 3'-5' exonuclease and polymerase domains
MISSNVILSPGELADAVAYFRKGPERLLSFDMETSGSNRGVPFCNRASWVGLGGPGKFAQIPFGHPIGTRITGYHKEPRQLIDHKNGGFITKNFKVAEYEPPPPQIPLEQVFEILRPLFFGSGLTIIGHGLQFDLATIAKYYGDTIPDPGGDEPFCDTIVLRWLIDENRKRYGLKYITKDIYGFSYDDEEVGKCVEKYPFNKVAHYLHCDVVYPLAEYRSLHPLISELDLERVFDLEMGLLPVLARMRLTGVKVDEPRLEEMRESLTIDVQRVEGKVYAAAGGEFNMNAARAKQKILFGSKADGGQALRPWKLTDGAKDRRKASRRNFKPVITDWSTDAEHLESLAGNPVVDAMLEYAGYSKLLGTYVLGYLGDPSAKDKPCRIFDGRIFPDFVQYGAKTGRFSCREPNLQNVGRPDTELGKLIRGAFIAEPGRKLIVADYEQIELVVLAHFLNQGALFEGFKRGIDPHTMTAALVLGKDPADVTKPERQRFGKSINFAVVYGAGNAKVAAMIGCSIDEAEAFLARHEKMFPEVYAFKDYVIESCRRMRPPHITTLFGRRRNLPGIHSRENGMRMYSERQAFNSLIQGSSADIMKLAMIRLHSDMPSWMKLHLTVHDELVCSAPDGFEEEGKAILLNAMTGPGIGDILRVPLKSDCAIVTRWSDAK